MLRRKEKKNIKKVTKFLNLILNTHTTSCGRLSWRRNVIAKRPSLSSNQRAASRKMSNNTGGFIISPEVFLSQARRQPQYLQQNKNQTCFFSMKFWHHNFLLVFTLFGSTFGATCKRINLFQCGWANNPSTLYEKHV